MLRHMGCIEITLDDQSEFEFWTRSINPNRDCETLEIIYNLGYLDSIPIPQNQIADQAEIFWDCIQKSLDANKKGQNGKRRILSIIADQFSYNEIKENLNISSSDTVYKARQYARLYGPGADQIEKPVYTRTKISQEKLDQLQQFLDDKNNVIMSNYKTDAKTGLPVKYLRDTKEALWEKFSYQFSDEFSDDIKRTSFMTFLQGKQYIYQEDLGGLCSICSRYGYEIFAEIKQFIEKNVQNNSLQKKYIDELEQLRRYYKRDYEKELKITANGTVVHDPCISHCLPYAFGICKESHTHECIKCGQLFAIFQRLKIDTPIALHHELDEYCEYLLYYLAHQTRKTYLKVPEKQKNNSSGKKDGLYIQYWYIPVKQVPLS